MIEHCPAGLGHPYRIEPDQRFPYLVPIGQPATIYFTTDSSTDSPRLQVRNGGEDLELQAIHLGAAVPVDRDDVPQAAPRVERPAVDEGHLAEAAARAGEKEGWTAWSAEIPAAFSRPGTSYRISSGDEETSWFDLLVVQERAASRSMVTSTDAEHQPEEITELVDQFDRVHEVTFVLTCSPQDRIVGFGERFDGLEQTGKVIDVRVYEQYKGQGARTYLPIPFAHVIGSNWAFWIDGGQSLRADVCAERPGLIKLTAEFAPETQPTLIVNIARGTPSQCLFTFNSAHGGSQIPPEWTFGLWLSSNEWNTQERVEKEVATALSMGLKPTVVVIEAWSDETTFAVFRDSQYEPVSGDFSLRLDDIKFPKDGAWPNPKKMIDELHRNGIRLLLWQIPALKERGADGSQSALDWDEAIERGFVVLDEEGAPYRFRGFWFHDALLPDFTNPEVREWWTERRRYLMEELGVDGFKTDGGEHPWGLELRYSDGTRGAATNNKYPMLYTQAYHELAKRLNRDALTFSRAGYSGSAQFPCYWAGDEDSTWDALRASLSAGLTASSSGIFFWGFDIGGFSGPLPTPELYLRATAFATFSPIMQIHSEFNHHRTPHVDRTPWNIEQQSGDKEVMATFKRFSDIRDALRPYIEEESRYSVRAGRPLMAPLFFDFADDSNIWSATNQYMFGRDLLVAPVVDEGATTIEVYLPKGTWVDVWTGIVFEGNSRTIVDVPLNRIPVFAKEGSTTLRTLSIFRAT